MIVAPSQQQKERMREAVSRLLFFDPKLLAYAVLDGAANPGLLDRVYDDRPEFECLYRGELEPDIAECAPYLVRLEADTPFAAWLLENCWGANWGIFALSASDLPTMRRHLRKFNMVYDPEENRPLLFRYYDPRVLRDFLPHCTGGQSAAFFGPIEVFIAESADRAGLIRFSLSGRNVNAETVS